MYLPSSESVSLGILDVHNIERSGVTFSVNNGTDTTQVTTSSDHAQVSRVEFDGIHDLTSGDFQLDGIVYLDNGIRIPDCSTVVGNQEWNTFWSSLDSLHLAQFVLQTQNHAHYTRRTDLYQSFHSMHQMSKNFSVTLK